MLTVPSGMSYSLSSDYSSSYRSPSESNNNYSPEMDCNGQVNSWQEWKQAKKTQSSVVYVNPDFIDSQELFVMDGDGQPTAVSPLLSPASPDEIRATARKGPKTPPEPEEFMEPGHTEVYLEEESDGAADPSPEPVKKKNELIRISVDGEDEVEEKEAGELDPDEEEMAKKKKEKIQERLKEKKAYKVSTKESEQKKISSRSRNSSSSREKKRRCCSRSREKTMKRARSRSRTRKQKRKRSRSSSRDTFDGISEPTHQVSENIRCNQCSRLFASAHDAAVHEIRSHDTRIPCAICAKVLLSPAKLVNHTEEYHANEKVRCRFCDEKFGGKADSLSNAEWNDFREHIFREVLRRKIKDYNNRCPDTVALRGVGRCPHGPAIKCRNFPKCPGSRCIYSHGRCDFAETCSNSDCPFDHSNRPRVCMACVKDLKTRRRTRSPPSRSRD